ncbi:MAG: hypothetical protein KDA75_14000, partial [Planctomycetaceae bacterium]|nr:hypothetical protein [Planctomycetaceae bacterium]
MLPTFWFQLVAARGQKLYRAWRRAVRSLPRSRVSSRLAPRLSFERLEDRTLLSTFTVSNNNDSGAGSLRQAILAAESNPGADDIFFAELPGEIDLTSGQMPLITQDLTIHGFSAANSVIDAQQASRIFRVAGTGVDLTLSDITLKNGRSSSDFFGGGAILFSSDGTLRLVNSFLLVNSTTGQQAVGGAIHAESSSSTVEIVGGALRGNYTTGPTYGVLGAGGGAVWADGNLTVTGSSLTLNHTTGENAHGGALGGGGTITVIESGFFANEVTHSSSVGGAIAHVTTPGSVTILRSTIGSDANGNTARSGGAIAVLNATLNVSASSIVGNSADIEGGGLFAVYSNVTVTNSTLSGNSGPYGGAISSSGSNLTVTNSTLTLNQATSVGGGIVATGDSGDTVIIQNSIIAGNLTSGTVPDLGFSGVARTVRFSLIGRNDATGLAPTSGTTPDANGNFVGGSTAGTAINPMLGPLQDNGGPTLTHELLATSLGVNRGSNAFAVDPANGNTPLLGDQRSPAIPRAFNTVDMGAFERFNVSGPIVVSTAVDELDGDTSNGDLSLREAVDLANISPGSNTIQFASSLNGTPIALSAGELTLGEGVSIVGNGADQTIIDAQQTSRIFSIFAAANPQSNVFSFDGVTLSNGLTNATDARGAAIDHQFGVLTISNSTLSGNFTLGEFSHGGAIHTRGNITIRNSRLINNNALDDSSKGGAISQPYFNDGSIFIENSLLSANTAGNGGGAVYSKFGNVFLGGSTVVNNQARGQGGLGAPEGWGGGLLTSSGDISIDNSTISYNDAQFYGGGIATQTGDSTITSSTITDNSSGFGAGIFKSQNQASITIHNSIIAGNVGSVPDISRPGSNVTFEVRNSLIGRSDTTG